ncbi:MAG TPA: glycosyltransferase [Gemmatimonadaceae bacterium]|nr:glycosyltransferase [Gemmatimonadaceae bacterium]
MLILAVILIVLPFAMFVYAYFGYPCLLWLATKVVKTAPAEPSAGAVDGTSAVRAGAGADAEMDWPHITITVPAYNEERRIRSTIESLLAIDYPADRRQILIASDASSDGTDAIVREFASQGVELLRVEPRGGKTNAENRAGPAIRGEIVVNTDASIRILPHSVKALVRALRDPAVGVASGRDISVGDEEREGNRGESGYVGYEMWVRSLETRLGSIVGASGCCYAARAEIQRVTLPGDLARDFASALIARQMNLRAVSVSEATCTVPRTTSLRAEMRRKVRTMAQGLETLWHFRSLMNPLREGAFALMLISHKLCRWLVYLTIPLALIGLVLLGVHLPAAFVLLALVLLGWVIGAVALRWPEARRIPLPLALAGFAVASNTAGMLAWLKVFRRQRMPTWEPTRRP